VIGAGALGCLALGLLGVWVRGVAWGVALLAAGFLVRLQLDPDAISAWTPPAAATLLLVAELAYWSFELDGSETPGVGHLGRRAIELVALAAAAGILCELALDFSQLLPRAGVPLLGIGVLAAAAVLGIVLRLARRGA
jgi:hypothetical protein